VGAQLAAVEALARQAERTAALSKADQAVASAEAEARALVRATEALQRQQEQQQQQQHSGQTPSGGPAPPPPPGRGGSLPPPAPGQLLGSAASSAPGPALAPSPYTGGPLALVGTMSRLPAASSSGKGGGGGGRGGEGGGAVLVCVPRLLAEGGFLWKIPFHSAGTPQRRYFQLKPPDKPELFPPLADLGAVSEVR